MKKFKSFLGLVCLVLLFDVSAYAKRGKNYLMATASTGGTFYPVGVGISTIASIKLAKSQKATFSAITSAGSAENIDMLQKKEVDFAILQGLFGSMAWQGKGKYKGKKKRSFRSITMLWENVEQFVVNKKYVKSNNIKGLTKLYGKGFSITARNSGSKISNEIIMQSLGIKPKKMKLDYLGYSSSATALNTGKIKGMSTPAGIPTTSVNTAFSVMRNKVKILEFNANDIKMIQKQYPVWTSYVIPANTYPYQKKAVKTIAQPVFLAVHKDVSDKIVYELLKTIYSNIPFLNSVHVATKNMKIKRAINGLPAPLHKGAIKFFKEKKIKIPKRLMK